MEYIPIDCGFGVHFGDYHACNTGGFDNVLHIWRGRDVDAKSTRDHILNNSPGELVLRWREGELLSKLLLEEMMDFFRRPVSLLVHCRSGHCRSAHLAVLAVRARGGEGFEAIDRINCSLYGQRGVLPGWFWEVMTIVLSTTL